LEEVAVFIARRRLERLVVKERECWFRLEVETFIRVLILIKHCYIRSNDSRVYKKIMLR